MLARKLSPKEQRRLERFMRNVSILSRRENLAATYRFIMRRQMRAILLLLGSPDPTVKMIAEALDIMKDYWPFKKRRLRKLING